MNESSPVAGAGPAPLPTVQERRDAGQERRRVLPRSAHAEWTPAAHRTDPVRILEEQNASRIPALVPLRMGRMKVDALAFLRGAAAIMAADLGSIPNSGLIVQACGDAHLLNFSTFASPEGTSLFDVNDFDETLPAPFEWDLKRLAASFAVAGRVHGLGEKACRALVRRSAHAYRRMLDELASVPPLDAWRARIDLDAAVEDIGDRDVRKQIRIQAHQAVQASRDAHRHLVARDGTLRLPERPPAVYRLGPEEHVAHVAFASFLASLAEERRVLVERYRLHDVAFKAVGVGSVGMFAAIGLFATADHEVLLLQLKEAQRSVLAPYAGDSAYANQGQRVVVGQRMMQAAADVFLGWNDASVDNRHFYVRGVKDSRLAGVGTSLEASGLPFYARLCGRTLARSHARSGDAAMISGYLGNSDSFDDAIAEFALAYADQTKADHEAFVAAIKSGRIEVADDPKR
ncbi:MAG TPA: DUF2252 domain-containing protein [Acetobacteraceae bacterium]|jgi:uncharacterized protein (DUF2252 family)|nr:DUF2252 domain-containing protein [Acetobacteraceae bacterium]